jgi:hypothetical protein
MLKTTKEFALACKDLTANEIYELFEDDISDDLRDAIYAAADPKSPEPCRSAMIKLGNKHDIQSLIDY